MDTVYVVINKSTGEEIKIPITINCAPVRRRPYTTTPGSKFSRTVGVVGNSILRGTVPTGAKVDIDKAHAKIFNAFSKLSKEDYKDITPKARETLKKVGIGINIE